MSQEPDYYVDSDGNVIRNRGQKKHSYDSHPPLNSLVSSEYNTSPKRNQSSGGVILVPVGLIITLILALLRSCASPEPPIIRKDINSYESGMMDYVQGDYQMALIHLNSAISSNPEWADAYNVRGLVYDAQGNYDLALVDFNMAIKLQPGSALPYNNRGVTYCEQGEFELAISDFNQAIQFDAGFAKAYFNRGLVNQVWGYYDAAITDFTKAIELTPEEYAMGQNLTSLQVDRRNTSITDKEDPFGITTMGISEYMELLSTYANLPLAYANRGFAYFNNGDTVRATADLEKALDLGLDPSAQDWVDTLLQFLR